MVAAEVLEKVVARVFSAASPRSIDRSHAFLYALPLALACIGLVGCWRRRMLRAKFGIGGSALGDFVCHCLCTCCSLAKESREIRRQALDELVAGAEQDLKTSV